MATGMGETLHRSSKMQNFELSGARFECVCLCQFDLYFFYWCFRGHPSMSGSHIGRTCRHTSTLERHEFWLIDWLFAWSAGSWWLPALHGLWWIGTSSTSRDDPNKTDEGLFHHTIISDSRCGMSDFAFRTAPTIGGPSCLCSCVWYSTFIV